MRDVTERHDAGSHDRHVNARHEMGPDDRHGHPFAIGLIAGEAMGAGLGLCLAPRKGAETRHQIRSKVHHVTHAVSSSYHRAGTATGEWAERGRHAYTRTRQAVGHGAHETRRYVRDVADAVRRKTRSESSRSSPQLVVPSADIQQNITEAGARPSEALRS